LKEDNGKVVERRSISRSCFFAERVFSHNYTERLIWLGMLRSLKGKELEPKLRSYLSSVALNGNDGQHEIVSGELAIAWLAGKL
jgi:hypothetical protein